MTDFRQALEESDSGVVVDRRTGGVLLVAFGGLTTQMGGRPPFEFFNLVANDDIDKIFVRDLSRTFYQSPIKGLGENIPEIAKNLGELIEDANRVVFVGNSAGG